MLEATAHESLADFVVALNTESKGGYYHRGEGQSIWDFDMGIQVSNSLIPRPLDLLIKWGIAFKLHFYITHLSTCQQYPLHVKPFIRAPLT